jgi:hypothetical protein
MIKALKNLGIERMFLSIIVARYDKPIVNITPNEEQLKPFPNVRNETRMHSFLTPTQDSFGFPS